MTKEELLEKLSPLNENLVKVKSELQKILDTKRELKETFITEHSKYKVGDVIGNYIIDDIALDASDGKLRYYLYDQWGDFFDSFNEDELNENFTK